MLHHLRRKGTVSAPSWSPTDMGADLLGWYDAQDSGSLTLSGSDVTQWNDKSGNSMHLTQGTAGRYPQYSATSFNSSYPGLTFSDDYMEKSSYGLTSGAVCAAFIVCTMTTNCDTYGRAVTYGNYPTAADYDTSGNGVFILRDNTTNAVTAYTTGASRSSKGVSLSTPMWVGSVFDGTNHTMYVDNVAASSSAFSGAFTNSRILRVGTSLAVSASTEYWDGVISEVIITKATVDSTLLTNIDTYFNRWGI